ncbi:MAG: hypothetical protein M1823_002784 [Watsoniomyces obsoletus]|nr:MAG: hypothetical protein M1823_002784 [Watsoniomyces obsoletus]
MSDSKPQAQWKGKRKRTEIGEADAVEDNENHESSSVEPASNAREGRSRIRNDQKLLAWPSTASLDETALLALGILLEESCLQALGRTGDLVFTEGELVHPSHDHHRLGRRARNQQTSQDTAHPGYGSRNGESEESDINTIKVEEEEEDDKELPT